MADYKKMYAILCSAMSDAIDSLEDIPLARNTVKAMKEAMNTAEDIYLDGEVMLTRFKIPGEEDS